MVFDDSPRIKQFYSIWSYSPIDCLNTLKMDVNIQSFNFFIFVKTYGISCNNVWINELMIHAKPDVIYVYSYHD